MGRERMSGEGAGEWGGSGWVGEWEGGRGVVG